MTRLKLVVQAPCIFTLPFLKQYFPFPKAFNLIISSTRRGVRPKSYALCESKSQGPVRWYASHTPKGDTEASVTSRNLIGRLSHVQLSIQNMLNQNYSKYNARAISIIFYKNIFCISTKTSVFKLVLKFFMNLIDKIVQIPLVTTDYNLKCRLKFSKMVLFKLCNSGSVFLYKMMYGKSHISKQLFNDINVCTYLYKKRCMHAQNLFLCSFW